MKKILKRIGAAMLLILSMGIMADHICVEPDHLISYPLTLTSFFGVEADILLEDQFLDLTATTGNWDVVAPIALLNPATKWYRGQRVRPQHPGTHYAAFSLAYDALDTEPISLLPGNVRVFSQFDNFSFTVPDDLDLIPTVGNPFPLQLLVPSAKQACPNGHCSLANTLHCPDCGLDGDHYLCYAFSEEFQEEHDVHTQGRLEDQFQRNRLFDHLTPTKFCNPVQKTDAAGNVTDFTDEETNHLVCFSMCEKHLDSPRLVRLLNQFGEQAGLVEHDNEICVPAIKLFAPAETGL